jgi:hypothetical protein
MRVNRWTANRLNIKPARRRQEGGATCATLGQLLELIDDLAADDPLWALRELPEYLSPYRLDCCATAEPEAALLYAEDLLTPERRAACEAASAITRTCRFFPDRLGPERLKALLRSRGIET